MNDIRPIDGERIETTAVERPDIPPDPTGEGSVEMLRKALAVIEGSSCSETRVLEVARAARDALLVEFVEGKGGEE